MRSLQTRSTTVISHRHLVKTEMKTYKDVGARKTTTWKLHRRRIHISPVRQSRSDKQDKKPANAFPPVWFHFNKKSSVDWSSRANNRLNAPIRNLSSGSEAKHRQQRCIYVCDFR